MEVKTERLKYLPKVYKVNGLVEAIKNTPIEYQKELEEGYEVFVDILAECQSGQYMMKEIFEYFEYDAENPTPEYDFYYDEFDEFTSKLQIELEYIVEQIPEVYDNYNVFFGFGECSDYGILMRKDPID